jgi:hypothetical protein
MDHPLSWRRSAATVGGLKNVLQLVYTILISQVQVRFATIKWTFKSRAGEEGILWSA